MTDPSQIPSDSIAGMQLKKRAIIADPAEIRRVIEQVKKESPGFDGSEKNIDDIFTYLWETQKDFNLENVREAVESLMYYNAFD